MIYVEPRWKAPDQMSKTPPTIKGWTSAVGNVLWWLGPRAKGIVLITSSTFSRLLSKPLSSGARGLGWYFGLHKLVYGGYGIASLVRFVESQVGRASSVEYESSSVLVWGQTLLLKALRPMLIGVRREDQLVIWIDETTREYNRDRQGGGLGRCYILCTDLGPAWDMRDSGTMLHPADTKVSGTVWNDVTSRLTTRPC